MLAEGVGGNGKTSCAITGARASSVVLPAGCRASADSFSSAARTAGNRPPADSQASKPPKMSATKKGHFVRIWRVPFLVEDRFGARQTLAPTIAQRAIDRGARHLRMTGVNVRISIPGHPVGRRGHERS